MSSGLALRVLAPLRPGRAVAACLRSTAELAAASAQAATTLVNTGIGIATYPVREGVKLTRAVAGAGMSRRCWSGEGRAWIEVRGLHGPGGHNLGPSVLDAVRDHPGVTSARLNYPLSRVVVEMDGDTTLRDLCRVVAEAEKRPRAVGDGGRRPEPTQSLPGDGLLLAARMLTLGANAAGLGTALAGRALRWPRLPASIEAAVLAVDYQPVLRRLLEDHLGKPATDTVLTLAAATVHTLTLSPAALAVDVMMEALKAAEDRAAARAWRRGEPALARRAEHPAVHPPPRPSEPPAGPVEWHADRSAWLQLLGAAVVGAATRNPDMAGTAAMVATPKASRTSRESFAATLGRGLADHHGVLALRPETLRRLDRVDVLVIDPRVLWDTGLRVVRVRGADGAQLATAWGGAQARLADNGGNGLHPGWHRIGDGDVEALFQPAHHPLASTVVAEARRADVEVATVDVEALGELRSTFDEILPPRDEPIDEALTAAVIDYQRDGHTVAVLSSAGAQALSAADVALGVVGVSDASPPPWCADLLLPDLVSAWQVLHALPAARAASRRGVEISVGASALGALLMLPGVRGRGPGPVTTGAAAGALSGYWLARRAVGATVPTPAPVHEWHAMSVQQVRTLLPPPPEPGVPLRSGRPIALAAVGLAGRGAALAKPPGQAIWQFAKAVRAELADPMTPVLALGAAASAVLGSPVDAVLVGSVLGANAMLAAAQRLNAERRLNTLLVQQVPPARRTLADGSHVEVVAERLRPGDVIEVHAHEVVPADGRLIEVIDLEVDESSLTGESMSVTKQVEATPGANLADRHCMLYAGSTVVTGTAIAVVTAVGAGTQARRAADLVAGDQQAVGLQHQLGLLTNQAWKISQAGGALVTGLGLLRRAGLRQAVTSGIAVSVAAIPEGLPLVATLAQQASARRLTNTGALVRVPRSVEALGRVDVVCFDKTGTLSENRLRVARVHPAGDHAPDDVLRCAARAAPPPANGGRHVHATDAAISQAASAVNGFQPATEDSAHLPFRSGRPFSASVAGAELSVKGAPEAVLAGCGEVAPAVRQAVAQLAADGLRVIAVARRRLDPDRLRSLGADPEPDAIAELCGDGLSLVGFLGLSDTPRDEAPGLLAALQQRNIPIRLITGDHPITATTIARELGLPVAAEQVISGAEWEALSRKDQERAVGERVVFARMSPEHKVQIVQTLERTGRVCAMVGDGANDAAAIRAATVGIGVVAHGSDPARTAADVVLLDGRIDALLDALEEGRQLWQRVQAAVAVLLGGNAGEVGFAIVGSAVTGRSPLNARQLLLVNMLTDALPATALAVSQPSAPVPANGGGPDPAALWRAVAVRGVTTAAAAITAWALASVTGRQRRAATVALVALVATQLGQTLLDSHDRLVVLTAIGSLAVMGTLITIPGTSQLLGCTPLGPVGWAQALGTAALATVAAAVLPPLLRRDGAPSGTQQGTTAGGDGQWTLREESLRTERHRMAEKKARRATPQREAVERIRSGETFAVDLPILGRVTVPHPEQLAYYGGLVLLAAFGILDWPVTVAVAAGHILASQQHNKMLEQFGEALEEA